MKHIFPGCCHMKLLTYEYVFSSFLFIVFRFLSFYYL